MQLELAAYGWQGPEWSSLYPDDLPSEWRLDYYGNEFSAIVVPAATWQATSIDEASGWLAEAPAGFRFYWELEDADGAARLLELLSQADNGQGLLAGWLFRTGLKLEYGLFQALAAKLPGAAYGKSPLPTVQAEQLAAEGITLCWQDGEQLNCRGNGLRVLQITSYPDLRTLRQTVEEQAAEGVGRLLLLLKPRAATPAQMHDLLTFITLLSG
jgi:hypothetical protein